MERLAIAGAILASALGVPAFADTVDLRKTTIKAADGSEVPVDVAKPEVGESVVDQMDETDATDAVPVTIAATGSAEHRLPRMRSGMAISFRQHDRIPAIAPLTHEPV